MVKWASDYFIKAHVAPNKFYGQVGDGNIDHAYWGRPEEMTESRPVNSNKYFFLHTSCLYKRCNTIRSTFKAFFISASNPGNYDYNVLNIFNFAFFIFALGSDLAGETAAALAATSIVFSKVNATYSAICLAHAKDLYTFAKQYQGIYSTSISQAAAFYR